MIPLGILASALPRAGAAVPDPLFASVTSLAHLDGLNGSTAFPDVKGFSWIGDSVVISTAQSRFGGASLSMGTGGSIRTTSAGKFDFGSGAFALECFIRPVADSFGSYPNIFSSRGGGAGITLRLNPSAQLEFFWGDGNNAITGTSAVSTSTWSHVALTRTGNIIRLFLNGVLQASVTVSGSITTGQSSIAYIGYDAPSNSEMYRGFIDEFRATKGTSRYSANFMPPVAPFPNFGP